MLKLMGKKILKILCSNPNPKEEVGEIEIKRLRKRKEKVKESRSLKNVICCLL